MTDDIGWTVDDQDAQDVGIYPAGYRNFLNKFFTGKFPGSFSKGVPFQFNADTGDVRISGKLSSLAGLEDAIEKKDDELIDLRRKLPTFQNGGMEVIHRGNPRLYRMVFFIHPEEEGCPLGLAAALIYKHRQSILYKCHCRFHSLYRYP